MKCPYCGAEMKAGRIQTLKDLSIKWLPEGVKMPKAIFFDTTEKKGGRNLGKFVEGANSTT